MEGRRYKYIGVTGFMTRDDLEAATNFFVALGSFSYKYTLMAGVLASGKTLRGEMNKWPGRFPKVGDLGKMLSSSHHPLVLNMIHYATDRPENLAQELQDVICQGGGGDPLGYWCDGFQLNITWPPPEEIRKYRNEAVMGEKRRLVLQVNRRAFDAINHSPKELADKVRLEYADLVDDVLLDASNGRGQLLDISKTRAYLEAIKAKCPNMGLIIAGGLSAETVGTIEPLLQEFPDISIDAEGALRTPPPEDKMNMGAVRDYLERAVSLLAP